MTIGAVSRGDLVLVNSGDPPMFGLYLVTGVSLPDVHLRIVTESPMGDITSGQDRGQTFTVPLSYIKAVYSASSTA